MDNILSRVKYSNTHGAIVCIMVGLPGTSINDQGKVVFMPGQTQKNYMILHDLAEQNGGVYVGR